MGRRLSDVTDSRFPTTWGETLWINSLAAKSAKWLLWEESPLGGANTESRWLCGLQAPDPPPPAESQKDVSPHLDPGYTHPDDRRQRPLD